MLEAAIETARRSDFVRRYADVSLQYSLQLSVMGGEAGEGQMKGIELISKSCTSQQAAEKAYARPGTLRTPGPWPAKSR